MPLNIVHVEEFKENNYVLKQLLRMMMVNIK